MKKILLSATALLAVAIVYIIITAQKTPEKSKFYYAFQPLLASLPTTNKQIMPLVKATPTAAKKV